MGRNRSRRSFVRWPWIAGTVGAAVGLAIAGNLPLPMTFEDFRLSGTQVGDVVPGVLMTSDACAQCHGTYDPESEPFWNWKGSLMGQAGRDPLYYAQMTTANQDVANVGYFCMRCHVPMSFVTGSAYTPDGSALGDVDRDGVTCHFCHSMVDPIHDPGVDPPEDLAILEAMPAVPRYYGNAMFVLDPSGLRRGPYRGTAAPHEAIASPFHLSSELCGTCHDVGNVAVTRQPDGTYRYNDLDRPAPSEDLREQFPLERTYTEWKLSAFADGGVDMAGRFGGDGPPVVSTCQDCHMPKTTGRGCYFGPVRRDLPVHDFAGASSWVLEIIGLLYADDPGVDLQALEAGKRAAVDMLRRAASLKLLQEQATLRARVINETGHKLPTGHIEGRRVWVNVNFLDDHDAVLREYGHYDPQQADLDEASTVVYEMHVGLSEVASQATGLPAGVTTHMALADTIEKDTRIPPRGFDNAAFEAAGAPVVGRIYADGQYWDDTYFWIPDDAATTVVTVYYQTVTRHYIEALRDGNVTDDWGQTLYDLWLATDKGPPVPIVSAELDLLPFTRGDFDGDTDVDADDLDEFEGCYSGPGDGPVSPYCARGDFDGDGDVDCFDWIRFDQAWTEPSEPACAACGLSPAAVPNGGDVPGSPLGLAKAPGGSLRIEWSASCLENDGDYEVYEGVLGDFASHLPLACSTGGLTGATVVPIGNDAYYLIVPRNASVEGSYGTDGAGAERPPSPASCLPQVIGTCP